MKVKYDKERETPVAKRSKKSRRLKPTFYIFIVILAVGIITALVLTVLFSVKEYSINGASIYTKDEIILASGIDLGDNLIRISTEEAEANIEKALPYIKDAEIKRQFPSTVSIVITAAEEYAQLPTVEGYGLIDEDYKLLKYVTGKSADLAVIKGVELTGTEIGSEITFDDQDRKKALDAVRAYAESYDVNITYYDVSDHLNVCFAIDDRVYIELGSIAYIERKFPQIIDAIRSEPSGIQMKLTFAYWSVDNNQCIGKTEDISDLIK